MKICIKCNTTETKKWYYASDSTKTLCKSCFNKQYIKNNRKRMNELRSIWMKMNNKRSEYEAKYRTNNSEKYRLSQKIREAKHRADKLLATPKWLTKEQKQQIKDIYKNCPKGYHVDHIVPLKGKEVKGLHVPWNLQCLPSKVNIAKSNKLCDII